MTSPINLVGAAATLTAVFGDWPSFHDAEVVRLVLDRSGRDGPTLDAVLHVFEMTDEVDAEGFFVLRNHTFVALRFHDLDELELSGFNHQNVLSDLLISAVDPEEHSGRSIAISMGGCFGVGASFVCKRCDVVSAEPWRPVS